MARQVMTGNEAVATAVRYAGARFVAAYPITPQTSIVEKIAYMVEKGLMDAVFVNAESEHSALALAYGAALAGLRSFTATSSHGLLYMHEWVHWVSRSRVPLVMAVVTRAIGPPWNIWNDHSDFMDQRDAGWVMKFAMDPQEAFDMTVQAFRLSEDERVFLPVMVGLDGFLVSAVSMPVDLPEERAVREWVGERRQPFVFDGFSAMGLGNLTLPEETFALSESLDEDLEGAEKVFEEVERSYCGLTGKRPLGSVEEHGDKGSRYAVVSMGAWSGDLMEAVDALSSEGYSFSLHRVRLYRPFPCERLRESLRGKRLVVVYDRSVSFGSFGPLYADVRSCLEEVPMVNLIGGIGGLVHTVEEHVRHLRSLVDSLEKGLELGRKVWMGVGRVGGGRA